MRTLARTACFTLAASFFAACSPNLGDGRVLCASSAPLCPDGYSCVNGRCYRGAPDAGGDVDDAMDASSVDAPGDAGDAPLVIADAGNDTNTDAFRYEPTRLAIDLIHPVTDALVGPGAVHFARISAEGLELTYCRESPSGLRLFRSTREDLESRFRVATEMSFGPVTFTSTCAAQPAPDSRENYYFEAGAPGSESIFFGGAGGVEELTELGTGVGHPFLHADGGRAALLFERGRTASGLSEGLFVSERLPSGFQPPTPIVFTEARPAGWQRDMFPTLSHDGYLLFFLRVTTGGDGLAVTPMIAQRNSLSSWTFSSETFRALGALDGLGSFMPLLATGEVFATAANDRATAGNASAGVPNEGLFRARLCAGRCPERENDTRLEECPMGQLSADGLHCYSLSELTLTHGSAATSCRSGTMPTDLRRRSLVSIHSGSERALAWAIARPTSSPITSVWIGASATAASGPWTWASGESNTDNTSAPTFWATGQPAGSVGLCATLSTTGTRGTALGFGATADCRTTWPALCELDLWPTWR